MYLALGDDYLSQHCIQELTERRRREAFRIYIADSLWCVAQHKALEKRWADICPTFEKPLRNERTGADIIAAMLDKFEKMGG